MTNKKEFSYKEIDGEKPYCYGLIKKEARFVKIKGKYYQIYAKCSNGFEWWSEYDSQGNETHFKDSYGFEWWSEYDSQGNETYFKSSDGREIIRKYDNNGKLIKKTTITTEVFV